MAKRNHIVALAKSQRGQISIFFSASLMVFISIIAFVINVGLFVKAKINLQNATDAAAFSGAAVQARQLTKIAYLNWEMRNVYKEWMYKYYVVGSLNTPGVESSRGVTCTGGTCSDFRLAEDVSVISDSRSKDNFNFPAVCIHIAGGQTNICKRFAVPGLPEFGGYNIPGTEEASRAFFDSLIGSKINDCAVRSELNMIVTTNWAYNVLSKLPNGTLAANGPAILTDRQGAWPRALEIAIRIRNLEKVVNRAPAPQAVCFSGSGNCAPIAEYENGAVHGNERVVKAFFSGYRNLGSHTNDEMKNSFQLTELKPRPFIEDQGVVSNSSLLIPQKYDKHYLDLKIMLVNYATFFAALIPRASRDQSGACDISKVAIPVPGYPLGFYKNPDVLTYYAVKGEAEFEGMFNPFSTDKIKLTAYAAAKPFGGRIGPMLFAQKGSGTKARNDSSKYRSVPYISSLDVIGTPLRTGLLRAGEFAPGVPLPINLTGNNFWFTQSNAIIGGTIGASEVTFGIPNLAYEFPSERSWSTSQYATATDKIHRIKTSVSPGVSPVGLFNHDQFLNFKGVLEQPVSASDLNDHISRIKAPNFYEAANYLIPTANQLNKELGIDSFGAIPGIGVPLRSNGDVLKYSGEFYAPLYSADQEDVLYKTSGEIVSAIATYMRGQQPSMDSYTTSMNSAAKQTYLTSFSGSAAAAVAAQPQYKKAAMKISDIDLPDGEAALRNFDPKVIPNQLDTYPKSCKSLAGQFLHFYYGHQDLPNLIREQAACPVTLLELINQYYSANANDPSFSASHYRMDYNFSKEKFKGDQLRVFSAYMPGPYNGIGSNGEFSPPTGFQNPKEMMRRNFYSTKLIPLGAVQDGGIFDEKVKNFVIYSEGDLTSSPSFDRSQERFINSIDSAGLEKIKY